MAGSIRALGSGGDRWELRVYAGVVAGKKKWVSRTHRGDRAGAEVALARLVVAIADGTLAVAPPPDPDDPTLLEWMTSWAQRQAPKWAPGAVEVTSVTIGKHITGDPIASMRLGDIRLRHVEQWLGRLRSTRGGDLKPSTRIRYHTVLHSALEQAVRWELIARNPASGVELPRIPYEESRVPTAAELLTALELADGPDERTLLWLAAATGARRGMLLALRWADFDLELGVVTFHRGVVKTKGGTRIKEPKGRRLVQLAIDPVTVDVVRTYRRHRQEVALAAGIGRLADTSYLFARDPAGLATWYPDTATKVWSRIRSATHPLEPGEETARRVFPPEFDEVSLHDLRHAHATFLIAAGVDPKTVSGRLGHSRVGITLDTYTAPVTASDRAAAELIGKILTGT
ncbi:MAG: site-specific integrase [Actinomycetota bacterium]|nr:site-specific integrase [Actinomycetota bacterium]